MADPDVARVAQRYDKLVRTQVGDSDGIVEETVAKLAWTEATTQMYEEGHERSGYVGERVERELDWR